MVKQKIVYVDGFHIRTMFGDMDFNIFHAYGISFHVPWYVLPGEILVEQRVKDELPFLMQTEKLERKLDAQYPNGYQTVRALLKKRLCKKIAKSYIRKTYCYKEFLVREIDGGIVRRSLDPDFVSGGHYLVYPDYIPKGEIWLDSKLDSRELPYFLVHESVECRLMRNGVSYAHAHDQAMHAEKLARVREGRTFFVPHNPFRHLPFITFQPHRRSRLLIGAGIHGDERSGTFALAKMLRAPKAAKIFFNKPVDILPLLNPQGFDENIRQNLDNQDLNRYFGDHTDKKSPKECIMLKNFFKTITKPYTLLISLHEDPKQKKFYLYDAGNGKNSPLVKNIFRAVKKTGAQLYTGIDDPNDPLLNQMVMNGYIAVGPNNPAPTLEDYLVRNKKVKRAITLEIPGKLPLDKKVRLAEQLIACVTKNIQ